MFSFSFLSFLRLLERVRKYGSGQFGVYLSCSLSLLPCSAQLAFSAVGRDARNDAPFVYVVVAWLRSEK